MADDWQEYLDWKAGPGAQFEDPMFEFLKERDMYPGDYVKELAQKIIREGLKLPPSRWLWLRFTYSMLENPLHPGILTSFDHVTYKNLLWGTYVTERKKLWVRVWLRIYLITFRIYQKIPRTYYQKWKAEQEEQRRHNEEMRKKTFARWSKRKEAP